MGRRHEVNESQTRYFDVLGTQWAVTQSVIGWEEPGNRSGHPDTWEPDDGDTETKFTGLSLTRDGKTADYDAQLEQAYAMAMGGEIKIGTGVLSLSLLAACETLWERTGTMGLLADETDKEGKRAPFQAF